MSDTPAPLLGLLSELKISNSFQQLPDGFFKKVMPSPLQGGQIIGFNIRVCKNLGLNPCKLDFTQLSQIMTGNELLADNQPIAMKYSGHQFGQYNPELGDGRGLLLAEIETTDDLWDLHLKGAGKTPYSRFGDGRAVLRSSIREYMISEYMHQIGIASTDALALCVTQDQVARERYEPCATVLRVSRCHIRFGHFQHFYYTRQFDQLKQLADYCIGRFWPEIKTSEKPYLALLNNIFQANTQLVAQWQSYGFVHGVMNTDNISILGETFDYGPYAFMDAWQHQFVANHTDQQGRYAFAQQPNIMQWNLSCLAQAMTPLIDEQDLKLLIDNYWPTFKLAWQNTMAKRLGLKTQDLLDESAISLLQNLYQIFDRFQLDGNRWLYLLSRSTDLVLAPLISALEDGQMQCSTDCQQALQQWLNEYQEILEQQKISHQQRQTDCQQHNPEYILRNNHLQQIIEQAYANDFSGIKELFKVIENSRDLPEELKSWAKTPKQSEQATALSCSS